MKQNSIIHPGLFLQKYFLKKRGISEYRLAKDIAVPARRINEIVHGLRGITPDTALRFAAYFKTSTDVWLKRQNAWDIEKEKKRIAHILSNIGKKKKIK